MTRRLPKLLLVGLLLASTAMACEGTSGAGGFKGTVRIALVDVFSGPDASAGEYVQNSLQAELDAVNAAGGVLGRRLELVSADDEEKPDKGAELVREYLAEGDVKLLVGPSTTAVATAARQVMDGARVPNCTLNLSDEALAQAPYSFRIEEQDGYRVAALLGWVQSSRSEIKRIGLIADPSAPDPGYDRELQDQAPRLGLQYVGVAAAEPGDPSAAVRQLLATGAQAAILPPDAAAAAPAVQAVDQLGARGRLQLLGTSSLGSYSVAQANGAALDGVVFESTILSYLTDVPPARWPPLYRAFVARVNDQYGLAANGVEMKGVPAAADCILEWSKAVSAARSFDGSSVTRAWERVDLPPQATVLGAHEKVSAGRDGLTPDGIFVYRWAHSGGHLSLQQLTGPQLSSKTGSS